MPWNIIFKIFSSTFDFNPGFKGKGIQRKKCYSSEPVYSFICKRWPGGKREIAHCFVLFSSVVIFTATPNIWMRKAKKNRQNVTVANQFTVQLQKVLTDAYLPWKIIFKIVFALQIFENRLPSLVSSILGFSTTQSWGQSLFAVSACFALCWVLSILSLWLPKSLTGL